MEDVPLDITGHEERDPPGTNVGELPGNESTEDEPTESDSPGETTDGVIPDKTVEDGVEPIEVLVQLAEDGEIDPWDIDIVSVTDKFLERLDGADLRMSGRALFYASVLLRMKGDAMLADDDQEPEPEPWEVMMDDAPLDEPDPFQTLEREMDRRLERKRARGMPQTLDELVRDLREAERDTWWKESREYDTDSSGADSYGQGTQQLDYRSADQFRMDDEPTERDVTATTHGEDVDAIVEDVYETVREHYEQGRREVLFREVSTAGTSRVQTFLGLLFLAHRGQVRLRQDDLFGDLWIQDPAAVTGPDEALAD